MVQEVVMDCLIVLLKLSPCIPIYLLGSISWWCSDKRSRDGDGIWLAIVVVNDKDVVDL